MVERERGVQSSFVVKCRGERIKRRRAMGAVRERERRRERERKRSGGWRSQTI